MRQHKSSTAINVLGLLVAALPAWAWAGVAGTVTHLSGPLLAKKADGTVKILAVKSTVEEGDTLVSEKGTYARIKFIDDSEITLRPGTQFKIESFSFVDNQPQRDSAGFSLIKGGLRAVTGTLGKRNKEKFQVGTPTATIGIRGTIFVAEFVPADPDDTASYAAASVAWAGGYGNASDAGVPEWQGAPVSILPPRRTNDIVLAQNAAGVSDSPARPPGLYVNVSDGAVYLRNQGGVQDVAAGQFAFTGSAFQPPVILKSDPGIKFSPPPSFSPAGSTSNGGTGRSAGGTQEVDCEVR
jgi:hypothetical protein